MRKSDSWLTVSTSGELFMIVLTRVMGRLTSLPRNAPADEDEEGDPDFCLGGDLLGLPPDEVILID